MGTAINHRVPDGVKPSLVIFDIQALWRSAPDSSSERQVPVCQKLQMTGTVYFYGCTHMATVGVKGQRCEKRLRVLRVLPSVGIDV